jgi:hypothetical protein
MRPMSSWSPTPAAITSLVVVVGLLLGSADLVGSRELRAAERPSPMWRTAVTAAATNPPTADGSIGPARSTPQTSLLPAPTAPAPPAEPPTMPRPSAPRPQLLRIGVLDVAAPLVQVGLLPDGGMEIPDDVSVVGWYAVEGRTISPGDPGTAVLAGHRDSRRSGPGALHALADVAADDVLGVLHADGTFSRWRITEIMTTPRDALPVAQLFTSSGAPRLAVVTCGGWFNILTRSYSHNTIVIAHLIERAAGDPASTGDAASVRSTTS